MLLWWWVTRGVVALHGVGFFKTLGGGELLAVFSEAGTSEWVRGRGERVEARTVVAADSFAAVAGAVAAHKLTFIGPSALILEKFHSKAATRALLAKHGLPTIPGSEGVVTDEAAALEAAKKIGYPVILKASAGGGGRGMLVPQDDAELTKHLMHCVQKAQAACGSRTMSLDAHPTPTAPGS